MYLQLPCRWRGLIPAAFAVAVNCCTRNLQHVLSKVIRLLRPSWFITYFAGIVPSLGCLMPFKALSQAEVLQCLELLFLFT